MAFQSYQDGQQQAIADHWDGTTTDLDEVGASDRFTEGYTRTQAAIAAGTLGWMSLSPDAEGAGDPPDPPPASEQPSTRDSPPPPRVI